MFKNELKQKFQDIFKVKKVTFNAVSDVTKEQDCLFIVIDKTKNQIKDGQEKSLINGKAFMFARNEKLPFGFYQKCIKNADSNTTKDLFFYEIETNEIVFQDITKIGFSFIYFYSGQYDPDLGNIESIETTTIEEL